MPPRESDTPRHPYESGDEEYVDDYLSYEADDRVQDATTEEFDSPEPIPQEELAGLHYDASGMPLGPRRGLPLQDDPSALALRYLFPTEKFRGEWRKHWTYLFDLFVYGVGATLILGWLWGYLARQKQATLTTAVIVVWVLVMIWVGLRVGDWYFDRFILTNKRIMNVHGMFTRTVGMMPLLRVTDMKYEQSPMGRIFNYGNFVLESAGQDQALREVKHLPNPNDLYLRIVEEMYEPEAVEAKLSMNSPNDGS